MALHYNLAKVYDISADDPEFVQQILELFLIEVSPEVYNIKKAIKEKEYQKVHSISHKIKPTLDLLGMDLAYEEIIQIMSWAKSNGKKKEIIEVYKLLKEQIELASKEIRKSNTLQYK
jgi:hypothetical protein